MQAVRGRVSGDVIIVDNANAFSDGAEVWVWPMSHATNACESEDKSKRKLHIREYHMVTDRGLNADAYIREEREKNERF